MAKFGIGQGMKRKEDQRFLTGQGRYTDDLAAAGMTRAVLVRAPMAHARITGITTADAKAAPGVLAVLTGDDVAADGLGDLPCAALIKGRDGKRAIGPAYPLLARDRVRHVGDAVALVVAETLEQGATPPSWSRFPTMRCRRSRVSRPRRRPARRRSGTRRPAISASTGRPATPPPSTRRSPRPPGSPS